MEVWKTPTVSSEVAGFAINSLQVELSSIHSIIFQYFTIKRSTK